MIEFVLVRATHDELWRRRIPNRGVFASFAEPGRVLFSHVPAGFVLEPVVGAREHRPALVPDDLLVMQKPDLQQAVENLAGKLRWVPDGAAGIIRRRGG